MSNIVELTCPKALHGSYFGPFIAIFKIDTDSRATLMSSHTFFQVADNVWSPPNWKEQLVNIRRMRSDFDAPVDTMGCEKISDRDGRPKVGHNMRSTVICLWAEIHEVYSVKRKQALSF